MLISKKKRALILRPRDPDRILTVIPKAKKLQINGKTFVAVKHDVDEVKVLRNLGIIAPSPIKYHYDWPGQFKPFLAQRDTADFLTTFNRAFCLNDMGCVDSETEYLSPTGWEKISNYREGLVGQYVPETGTVEFVEPQEYVKKPCTEMYRLKTKYGLDQMLSPEHRVLLVSKESPGKREVVQAEELFARQEQWVETGKNRKSLSTIGWSKASIPVTYSVAGGTGLPLTDAELRVQIAVIADGHFPPNNTPRCTVRLKKPRKIERLRQLLLDAGIACFEREDSATPGFVKFSFDAPIRTKVFGAEFWNATNDQLAVVRDEVIHWDGCFRSGKTTCEFISNAKESADFVQYAFNAGGRTARIVVDGRGPTYSVLVRNNGAPLQVASVSGTARNRVMHRVPSTDGFKYCFMVPSSFLILRRNGCVFASGNTGKTLATLWAYDFLRKQGIVKKALVVSPLSTLERTWADEVFTHFPHLDVSVLYGTREKRLAMLEQDADLYLINHDGIKVSGLVEALAGRPDIDLIVVDEIAQLARNSGTDRYRAINTIVNKQTPRRAWGLTGTPTPNAPTDAWAQCRLLVPEKAPPYFSRFRDMVMKQVGMHTWLPRQDAQATVFSMMQPAIRFTRDECVDLPPCLYEVRSVELTAEQKKAYREMLNRLKTEVDSGTVTAVNEAVKAQKLIQIACLCYDTPVLTSEGWIPIQNVTSQHLVWDGVEWVNQGGALHRGYKEVVSCYGVWMTEDHKVLTTHGWITAQEVNYEQARSSDGGSARKGLDRAEVRLPDCYAARGVDYRVDKMCNVDVPVRLRRGGRAQKPVLAEQTQDASSELWVPSRQRDAQDVEHAAVQRVGKNEAAVRESGRQGLAKLRRAWDNSMRSLAGVVRELLGGRSPWVLEGSHAGPNGQRRAVLPGELPVGYCEAAEFQQTNERSYPDSARAFDCFSGGGNVRAEDSYAIRSGVPVQMGRAARFNHTYDLLNCGPRNRFVVKAADESPLIVHNCGVVYDEHRNALDMDVAPRLKVIEEIVEDAGTKVIVFVPFVAVVERVAEHLREAGQSVEVIHGGVSKNERDRIFGAFQKAANPKVLVAQPAAMSHGLTLTAASTIIWYAPITSNDTFEQANARVTRPGQKHTQLIVMVEGTDIERRYYKRLKDKQKVQGVLLDMVQTDRRVAA